TRLRDRAVARPRLEVSGPRYGRRLGTSRHAADRSAATAVSTRRRRRRGARVAHACAVVQRTFRRTRTGFNVLGSPLVAVAHLMSVLASEPRSTPLQAGEIVTTGTITTARSVRAGEIWRSDIQGIGLQGIAVEFLA